MLRGYYMYVFFCCNFLKVPCLNCFTQLPSKTNLIYNLPNHLQAAPLYYSGTTVAVT